MFISLRADISILVKGDASGITCYEY